jgi:hypothetical protein
VAPFVAFVGFGVFYRRRAEMHKRFMVLAMLSVLPPAVTRLPLGPRFEQNIPVAAATSVGCILLCVLIDWARNRRLHRVFGWGFAMILVLLAAVSTFARTATWRTVSDSMLGLSPTASVSAPQ